MARFRPDQYDAFAAEAIQAILRQEHAMVWLEVEAKLAERPVTLAQGSVVLPGIDPHHLTNGRNALLARGIIQAVRGPTRGGSELSVVVLTDRYKRETIVDRTIRRKRLLQARYLSWTQESKAGNIPSLIGNGGERMFDASLLEAASRGVGYRLVPKSQHGVNTLFGKPVPGGALDNAAYLTVDASDTEGPLAVSVLCEVKNLRHWIYPSSWELYQLLDKASQLQLLYPERSFVPFLVCRKSHFLTFALSRQAGFFVYYTGSQPMLSHSSVDQAALQEVIDELGYDIVLETGPHAKVTELLCNSLPAYARAVARRWAQTAPICAQYAPSLRDPGLLMRDPARHKQILDEFKEKLAALDENP